METGVFTGVATFVVTLAAGFAETLGTAGLGLAATLTTGLATAIGFTGALLRVTGFIGFGAFAAAGGVTVFF